MNYKALDEALEYIESISESMSVNYSKIKYEAEDKEAFDKCVDKFKKRFSNIVNDIADQLCDIIQDRIDEDEPDFKQYNSVSKVKSKLKVELAQFEKKYRDPYEGEFIIYLNIGSDMFGDHYIVAYVDICKDGQENIFHKDYDVDIQIEG